MKKAIILFAAAAFLLAGCEYGDESDSSSGASSSYSPVYVPEEEYQVPEDVGEPVVLCEPLSVSLSEVDVETEEGGRLYFPVQAGEEEILFRAEGGTVLEGGGIHLGQGGYLTNVTPIQGIFDVAWEGNASEGAFPMARVSGMTIVDPFLGAYVTEGEKRLMAGNVLNYEPEMALFVPDDDPLLFYRAIASIAAVYLSPGGLGAVEINESYGRDTCSLFSGAGFRKVSLEKDLSGRDRFVLFGK